MGAVIKANFDNALLEALPAFSRASRQVGPCSGDWHSTQPSGSRGSSTRPATTMPSVRRMAAPRVMPTYTAAARPRKGTVTKIIVGRCRKYVGSELNMLARMSSRSESLPCWCASESMVLAAMPEKKAMEKLAPTMSCMWPARISGRASLSRKRVQLRVSTRLAARRLKESAPSSFRIGQAVVCQIVSMVMRRAS